ncbi:ABC transporter permease subunit [Dactylosporangium sp. AC04546]|uniref:ABC transporter permease subunit n=1 Tax=Dactylosporangium sp. AC04546 TaxID=2862460 RepID=UPI001EDE4E94|nr:ABC transporter permease subunit [Dactylosporangium sp. AC04546]WVK89235.1 ABC transporter permease subunit [Dactylosporangium sp. AC04546]
MTAYLRALAAEWTKFRTMRGWVAAVMIAAALIVGLGLLPGLQGSCGKNGPGSECVAPVGPGGEEVTDSLTFVHQALTGDGSVTVRLTGLTGELPGEPGESRSGLVPWAKAGLIVRGATTQGATYAAVMMTGAHGVRLQYDYVHDVAGKPGGVSAEAPRWLRLTRSGDTLTAAESTDGTAWSTVGSARLTGLPATVEAGLFVTSPQFTELADEGLFVGAMGGPSHATGVFDRLALAGGWHGDTWKTDVIGASVEHGGGAGGPGGAPDAPVAGGSVGAAPGRVSGAERDGDTFRLTGSGDIAPSLPGVAGVGVTITSTLVGTFAGLIVVVVLGAVFVTAEYRRGLIRTTFAAAPHRVRLLAAKATVVGGVTFVAGLIAAAVVVSLGQQVLRDNGVYLHPASTATEARVVVGTAALLAVAAVLALAFGAVLRRGVTAITTAVVVIVMPYVLAMTVLPTTAGQWLLRVSPAAAFALQQASPAYPQVANIYTPANGYFPLAPWAGLAVLAAWAAVAFAAAAVLLRKRDA